MSACVLSHTNLNVVELITAGFGDGGPISVNESNFQSADHIGLSRHGLRSANPNETLGYPLGGYVSGVRVWNGDAGFIGECLHSADPDYYGGNRLSKQRL